jgi:hypothetical protein
VNHVQTFKMMNMSVQQGKPLCFISPTPGAARAGSGPVTAAALAADAACAAAGYRRRRRRLLERGEGKEVGAGG